MATLRISESLTLLGHECTILSQDEKLSENKVVKLRGIRHFYVNFIKLLNFSFQKVFFTKGNVSFGLFGTLDVKSINNSNFDIIHLNWINGSYVSIFQVAKINKPVVWTIHDMWIFSGFHHVKAIGPHGKLKNIELFYQKFKKKMLSKKQISYISPSNWIKDEIINVFETTCIQIPNPLNHLVFKSKNIKKDNCFKILFLHYNLSDFHKGFHLLNDSLNALSISYEFELLTVAPVNKKMIRKFNINYPIQSLNYTTSQEKLVEIYNSVDLVAIPSEVDNYPSVAIESIFCGTPVVGFNIGGLKEIVSHRDLGALADPFSTTDLASQIEKYLKNNQKSKIQNNSFIKNHSYSRIGKLYTNVYVEHISDKAS